MENLSVFAVPFGFKEIFPNLRELEVFNSGLVFVSKPSIAGLENLIFHENNIKKLSSDTFWDCPDLKNLNLNNNQIPELDSSLFIYSPNLEVFQAAYNKIGALDRDLFYEHKNLIEINLNGNRIKFVGVDFLRFKSIGFVDLRSNECFNAAINMKTANQIIKLEFLQEIAINCSSTTICL